MTGTSTTIGSLQSGTSYQVQVRATNAVGDSAWSTSGTGTTSAQANNAPEFASDTATRSFPENTAAGSDIGAPLAATDADAGDTLTYSLSGTDAASFDIVSTSGQLRTKSGVTYDFETRSSYAVTVTAADGNGGSDSITVTITLTDVDEAPGAISVTGIGITSTPAGGGDTYRRGETIIVEVRVDQVLSGIVLLPSGAGPRVALTIGTATRYAEVHSVTGLAGGATAIRFRYTVAAGDRDSDGISIAANTIDLNGGGFLSGGGNRIAPTLAHPAVPARSGHKVDATPIAVPLAPDLTRATVLVLGRTLRFDWRSQAADAARAAVTGYRVERRGAQGADGTWSWTRVGSNLPAPTYPGTTRIVFSEPDVPRGTTRHYRVFALSASGDSPASVTVTGSVPGGPPSVTEIDIVSTPAYCIPAYWAIPAYCAPYEAGETVTVEVRVDRVLTGIVRSPSGAAPRIALTFGRGTHAATRYAEAVDMTSLAGGAVIWFDYEVVRGDRDPDGIAIGANAIEMNGGGFRDRGGNLIAPALAHPAVAADPGHKVDGGPVLAVPLAPDLTGVTVSVSGRTLGFRWTAPAVSATREPVTGYRVEWSDDGSTGWTAVTPELGPTATAFSEENVPPGTTRHYRVFALSMAGDSPASATVSGTVPAADGSEDPEQVTGVGVADARAREGEPVTFTVTLAGAAPSGALELAATPSSGPGDTATAGTDFATAVQNLRIPAGQTSTTFSVATTEDRDVEPDETFTVTLSTAPGTTLPAGVTIGDATATGTILDDDEETTTTQHLPWFAPASDPPRAPELRAHRQRVRRCRGGAHLRLRRRGRAVRPVDPRPRRERDRALQLRRPGERQCRQGAGRRHGRGRGPLAPRPHERLSTSWCWGTSAPTTAS